MRSDGTTVGRAEMRGAIGAERRHVRHTAERCDEETVLAGA